MTDATITRTGPDHRAAFRASTFADVLRSEWTKLRCCPWRADQLTKAIHVLQLREA